MYVFSILNTPLLHTRFGCLGSSGDWHTIAKLFGDGILGLSDSFKTNLQDIQDRDDAGN